MRQPNTTTLVFVRSSSTPSSAHLTVPPTSSPTHASLKAAAGNHAFVPSLSRLAELIPWLILRLMLAFELVLLRLPDFFRPAGIIGPAGGCPESLVTARVVSETSSTGVTTLGSSAAKLFTHAH
jgi:hypothetical protein